MYYSVLVSDFGLPPLHGTWAGHPLERAFDALDEEDARAGRPFRTSVVFNKETKMPGDGYFKSIFRLKGISAKSDMQRLEVFSEELKAAMKLQVVI